LKNGWQLQPKHVTLTGNEKKRKRIDQREVCERDVFSAPECTHLSISIMVICVQPSGYLHAALQF